MVPDHAQNKRGWTPSFDRWLRFDTRTAVLYERAQRDARVRHLRLTTFLGLTVYNLYIISNYLLMPDLIMESIVFRLFLATPGTLWVAWVIGRISTVARENLLVGAMLACHALPLVLFWQTGSDLSGYTFGEIALTVVYGNVILTMRFPQATVFTMLALLMAYAGVLAKQQIDPAVQMAFLLQISVASLFSLYANYLVEQRRCRDFISMLTSNQRVERAEKSTKMHAVMSKTDALTGLPNRRHLDEKLQDWFAQDQTVAVLMIDIDHFKLFNDSLGHPAGDDCLRQIAQVFKTLGRADVFCARFGGEEFTVLMRHTTELDAARMAQAIISGIAGLQITHPGRHDNIAVVTASTGIAHRPAGSEMTLKTLLSQADHALYRAKQRGRNGFVIADDTDIPATAAQRWP